jgi:hypothetical protein
MYLAADARFSALIGDSRRAFKRLKLLYDMTGQLAAEEFLLPQWVRQSLIGHGNRTAKPVLSTTDLSVAELTELAELVVRIERNMKLAPCLINERAAIASYLDAPDRLAGDLSHHGRVSTWPDQLVEPKFPELPSKWFEGKPFVYSKKGLAFMLEANPEVSAEITLPDDNHRDAWGMLLQIDAPKSKSESR